MQNKNLRITAAMVLVFGPLLLSTDFANASVNSPYGDSQTEGLVRIALDPNLECNIEFGCTPIEQPTPEPTVSEIPAPIATPNPSETASPSPSASPSASASPTPSASPTARATPTANPRPSAQAPQPDEPTPTANESSTSAEITEVVNEPSPVVATSLSLAFGAIDSMQDIPLEALTDNQVATQQLAAEIILRDTPKDSEDYADALDLLLELATTDDPELDPQIESIPIIGPISSATLELFNNLGNVGADISPAVREPAKKVLVSAVIIGQISQVALGSAIMGANPALIRRL